MRIVTQFLAAVVFLAGVALFVVAIQTPRQYMLLGASAAQITQVYAEATLYAVLSVAAFACGTLLAVTVLNRAE